MDTLLSAPCVWMRGRAEYIEWVRIDDVTERSTKGVATTSPRILNNPIILAFDFSISPSSIYIPSPPSSEEKANLADSISIEK